MIPLARSARPEIPRKVTEERSGMTISASLATAGAARKGRRTPNAASAARLGETRMARVSRCLRMNACSRDGRGPIARALRGDVKRRLLQQKKRRRQGWLTAELD